MQKFCPECFGNKIINMEYQATCMDCGNTIEEIAYADDDQEKYFDKQKYYRMPQKYKRQTHLNSLIKNHEKKELILNIFNRYEKNFDKIKDYFERKSLINYKYIIYRICQDNDIEFKRPKINKNKIKLYKKIYKEIKDIQ